MLLLLLISASGLRSINVFVEAVAVVATALGSLLFKNTGTLSLYIPSGLGNPKMLIIIGLKKEIKTNLFFVTTD